MHIIFALLTVVAFPRSAFAVLPPDILFSVGTQLWQIVAGVGALVVGSLATLFPFLRTVSLSEMRLWKFYLSFGITFVLVGSGYLLYIFAVPKESPPLHVAHNMATTTGYAFHSNRLVLLGTRGNKEPILINMDINRKELALGDFMHYYFIDVLSGKTAKSAYVEQVLPTSELGNDFFFSEFSRILPLDHSAREEFVFTFTLDNHVYRIDTELLTADFLIKNEPAYTAYVSVGNAKGSIDGEQVDFRVMSERIYSKDYRVSVFFDPDGKLKSESVQLVLWDEKQNFYMVDRSRVKEQNPAYASHFWGLTKESAGAMRRYFDGDATARGKGMDGEFHAQLGKGSGSMELSLQMNDLFANGYDEGYVSGTVRIVGSEEAQNVSGLATHRYYGKE